MMRFTGFSLRCQTCQDRAVFSFLLSAEGVLLTDLLVPAVPRPWSWPRPLWHSRSQLHLWDLGWTRRKRKKKQKKSRDNGSNCRSVNPHTRGLSQGLSMPCRHLRLLTESHSGRVPSSARGNLNSTRPAGERKNWLTVWLASTNAAPAKNRQHENDIAYERNDRDILSCDETKLFHVTS
jgi:hypothetical protein